MRTSSDRPTVYLVIGTSAIAYDDGGEILESTDWNEDGSPDWTDAGICDTRGGGGVEGFQLLGEALNDAERNAALLGLEVLRLEQSRETA